MDAVPDCTDSEIGDPRSNVDAPDGERRVWRAGARVEQRIETEQHVADIDSISVRHDEVRRWIVTNAVLVSVRREMAIGVVADTIRVELMLLGAKGADAA